MDYQFKDIEKKWQQFWASHHTFKADNQSAKPKYYVLDMFPYPSGAGLHVGHPLGYIASDIFSRYKRLKGFNVLHPMGYDSFGLPAEQYAIQTGQHPAITTEDNIATYRRQLDQLGFSFDWSREVRTSSPDYYKWTQWIFMQLFNSWYNKADEKAESIDQLTAHFAANGSAGINAVCDEEVSTFTADKWNAMGEEAQQAELLKYRLTYLRESTVNWCAALGTVLANDEVKDGVSERGGYPVEQKKMMQWSMRITAYAERLLQGLDNIDWPDPLKEMQRNWIGKSVGASVRFGLERGVRSEEQSAKSEERGEENAPETPISATYIEVFTTRVDTIFGVTFVVLAPEHELVASLTTPEQKATVEAYIAQTKKKSELDRMADTKTVSGAFTGSYVLNPLNGEKIQLWIADYVLAGYGTGAVMAVPSGDQRDYLFAKHFDLPIVPIMDIQNIEKEADPTKDGKYINSDFINGLNYKEATAAVVAKLEEIGAGKAKVNFRMRDAIFGRQRYWGEPVPVYFKNGLPYLINESELPLILPEIDKYLPTESGEPPLARAEGWKYRPLTPTLSKREGDKTLKFGYQTADVALWEILKNNARSNRSTSTEAETLLWQHLRNNQTGFKIRRQHAIGTYIADFICIPKGLIIEIDGGYHQGIQESDAIRTDALNQLGFDVIRFSNDEVTDNTTSVIQAIQNSLKNQPDRILQSKGDSNSNSLSFGEGRGEAYDYELSTMPGWAGSSWYWYRYMDAQNSETFASAEAVKYWKDVDLYIGGSEHATGHLLYSRFWNKFLKDIGLAGEEEPFKKLINQGMIQGRSSFTYRLNPLLVNTDDSFVKPEVYVSKGVYELYKEGDFDTIEQIAAFYKDLLPADTSIGEMDFNKLHVDVNIVHNDALDIAAFRKWRSENAKAIFVLEDGSVVYPADDSKHESKYICDTEVEKMSKSKFNVVNPDDLIERYGADTLRMYEMFLGPLEQSKPWNTNGIEGVFKFLRKFWRLFHNDQWAFTVSDAEPSKAELKSLHKIIRKVEEDIERFSFNTSVSSFMIAVNELTDLKCNKRAILQDMVVILSPYAPHICEELWVLLGNEAGTLSYAPYPKFVASYLIEDDFAYPISINGKTRLNLSMALTMEPKEVETFVLANNDVQKYLDGKPPKKVIVVKGRIVNIVV
ncbi:leucine--tRNA ligase [Mucilaginibacter terrae]|uniref:leucine--tRNA ligase n=1 Tax=Mucilaginibacter terrae TaxID=1955052 RepID=UPI0036370459